jgi:hypothetical protein
VISVVMMKIENPSNDSRPSSISTGGTMKTQANE